MPRTYAQPQTRVSNYRDRPNRAGQARSSGPDASQAIRLNGELRSDADAAELGRYEREGEALTSRVKKRQKRRYQRTNDAT